MIWVIVSPNNDKQKYTLKINYDCVPEQVGVVFELKMKRIMSRIVFTLFKDVQFSLTIIKHKLFCPKGDSRGHS